MQICRELVGIYHKNLIYKTSSDVLSIETTLNLFLKRTHLLYMFKFLPKYCKYTTKLWRSGRDILRDHFWICPSQYKIWWRRSSPRSSFCNHRSVPTSQETVFAFWGKWALQAAIVGNWTKKWSVNTDNTVTA